MAKRPWYDIRGRTPIDRRLDALDSLVGEYPELWDRYRRLAWRQTRAERLYHKIVTSTKFDARNA